MDDNYINFNFNTLDDLNNIPGKLEELNDLQLQLKDIAESKTSGKRTLFRVQLPKSTKKSWKTQFKI